MSGLGESFAFQKHPRRYVSQPIIGQVHFSNSLWSA